MGLREVLQKVVDAKSLTAMEWIAAGEAIYQARLRNKWTQVDAAKKLKIHRTKLQRLEKVGRWSETVKNLIRVSEDNLSHFSMRTLADRSWSDSRDLKRAINNIVDGKKLRKKRIRKSNEVLIENGPDRFNEIQTFTEALKTKVDIQGQNQGQIVIYFHNWEQYDRIKEIILK